MNYYTYIIYSLTKDTYYIGSTSNLESRLIKHNQKHSGFTGHHADWKLVYQETFDNKESTLAREKQIKSWKSRKKIEALIGSQHPD